MRKAIWNVQIYDIFGKKLLLLPLCVDSLAFTGNLRMTILDVSVDLLNSPPPTL